MVAATAATVSVCLPPIPYGGGNGLAKSVAAAIVSLLLLLTYGEEGISDSSPLPSASSLTCFFLLALWEWLVLLPASLCCYSSFNHRASKPGGTGTRAIGGSVRQSQKWPMDIRGHLGPSAT